MRRLLPLLFLSLAASVWPDVQIPIRTTHRAPQDAVVAIGNRSYVHLPDAPYATRDADAFALWATMTRGIPQQNVHRIHNATHRLAVMKLEAAMEQVGEGGTLWIFFAGQGGVSMETGERLLLNTDVTAEPRHLHRHAIGLRALLQSTERAGIEHTVLIGDVSFSGAGRDGSTLVHNTVYRSPELDTVAESGATVWLAADGYQLAAPLETSRQGLFSWAAIGALRGWADGTSGPRDGQVTLTEATRWVRRTFETLGLEERAPIARVHASRGEFVATEGARLAQPPDLALLKAPPLPELPRSLKQAVEAEEAEVQARDELERAIQEKAQANADRDWKEAVARFAPGTPQGEFSLLRFIDRYRAIRYPTIHGDILFSAEQIPDALALLRGRTTPWHEAFSLKPMTTDGRAVQIADAEVTQHVWTTVMGFNPSSDRRRDKPVTQVSWLDAVRFCNALSTADKLVPAYTISDRKVTWDPEADGYRLPTFAEWRTAAGGSVAYTEDPCDHANLADQSWGEAADRPSEMNCTDRHVSLAPVRSYDPNALGIHDLTGNVHEWLWDAADAGEDPLVAKRRMRRLAVGGSFRSSPTEAHADRVLSLGRDASLPDVGFRLARSAH